jgi:hypothetical protein
MSDTTPTPPPPRAPTAAETARAALALVEDQGAQLDALATAVDKMGVELTAAVTQLGAGANSAVGDVLDRLNDRVNLLEGDTSPGRAASIRGDIEALTDTVTALSHRSSALERDMTTLVNVTTDLSSKVERAVTAARGRGGRKLVAVDPALPAHGDVGQLVLKLMRTVDEIGKSRTGKATAGNEGNYQYRGIDDAMNAIGSAMRTVGLIMRTEVVSQTAEVHEVPKNGWVQRWTTVTAQVRYIFVSPNDGSEHVMEGIGQGRDQGDKAASKALSGAMKYALFQGLVIPVKGVNVDAETEPSDGAPSDDDQRPHGDRSWQDQPAYGSRAEYERAKQQPERRQARTVEQLAGDPAATQDDYNEAVRAYNQRDAERQQRPPADAAGAASPSPAAATSASGEQRQAMTPDEIGRRTVDAIKVLLGPGPDSNAERLFKLEKIAGWLRERPNLHGVHIDGVNLPTHITTARRMLSV